MKFFSWLGRTVKSVFGWLFLVVFGGTGVYGMLDEKRDGPAVIVVCLLLAALGGLLIISARRDRKRHEARDEEERQYRRRREEEARDRAALEERRVREARQDSVAWTAVECPGCGAVSKIRRGGVSRCEYCGTALEGKQTER